MTCPVSEEPESFTPSSFGTSFEPTTRKPPARSTVAGVLLLAFCRTTVGIYPVVIAAINVVRKEHHADSAAHDLGPIRPTMPP
jgi:hypothetical protein